MNKYLPSKKFVKVIGAVLVLGAVILAISMLVGRRETFENSENDSLFAAEGAIDNFYNADSDEDGVYDWEEGLWGTDPFDKDSDEDGISDGDEINQNKEEIRQKNSLGVDQAVSSDSLNQTEIFARQLFSAASLANQGGGLTVNSVDAFSKSFGDAIEQSAIKDPFTLVDLKLASVAPAEYKAGLAKVFDPYLKAHINPTQVIYNFSSGDTSALSDIESLSKIHSDISNELLKMQAPHNAAGIHLTLVNSNAKLSVAYLNMKNLIDDPVLAIVGFSQYQEYSSETEKALESLSKYFASNDIIR